MFAAMKSIVAAAPLSAVGHAVDTLAMVTDEEQHAKGFMRLQVLTRLHPDMAAPIRALLDRMLDDKVQAIREHMVKP